MSLKDKVEQALSEIRTVLQADGGDVELVSLQGTTVEVRLKGACAGCPSATATVRNVVADKIKEMCPEIERVRDVTDHESAQASGAEGGQLHGPTPIKGVASIVAVASGKGGVGKSTVAVNLALSLARQGLRTGVLDADVYGPSIPTMLGIHSHPKADEQGVHPVEKHGIKVMSIGFYLDQSTPVIWRGPMVMKALGQLLLDVHWGELDCLVVDLPPGTGDAQLTLVQSVSVTGVVVVTTPSDVALLDARRAVSMFDRVGVPVIGVTDNMSHFVCPHCGEHTDVFSRGGGRKTAEEMGVPFLGEIPLDPKIGRGLDQGKPVVATAPESPQSAAFAAVAEQVSGYLQSSPKDEQPTERA